MNRRFQDQARLPFSQRRTRVIIISYPERYPNITNDTWDNLDEILNVDVASVIWEAIRLQGTIPQTGDIVYLDWLDPFPKGRLIVWGEKLAKIGNGIYTTVIPFADEFSVPRFFPPRYWSIDHLNGRGNRIMPEQIDFTSGPEPSLNNLTMRNVYLTLTGKPTIPFRRGEEIFYFYLPEGSPAYVEDILEAVQGEDEGWGESQYQGQTNNALIPQMLEDGLNPNTTIILVL